MPTDDQLAAAAERVAEELATGTGPLTLRPLVGLRELSWMFGVGWNTPYQWRSRGDLPPPDAPLSGNPAWRVTTIYRWADETRRTIVWDPWGLLAPGEPRDQHGAPTEVVAEPAPVPMAVFSSSR